MAKETLCHTEAVQRAREKIPRFNSLETINHQIDSEAAWLSAIRGNLQ